MARALELLPKIAAAMERGSVSYSKARAITRIASPENEDYLLSIALHGTAHHVERLVQSYRRAKDAEESSREARQFAGRSVHYLYDEDGSMVLKARLPAEIGALLMKAFGRCDGGDLDARRSRGTRKVNDAHPEPSDERPTRAARRADALAVLAETFIKHGAVALNGGERYQIVVHVDAETLRTSTAGRCEIEEATSLPAETVRRLACDCSVVAVIENERGEPLNVGRKTRSIPPALRRALNARDRGCRFPGCTHTRYVDAHHVRHWAHGGETKASNLVTLCRFHHRKVHEGGVTVQVLDDGAFRFVRPDGTGFDSVATGSTTSLGDWTQLPRRHCEEGVAIDRSTAVTGWRGERMDYGIAVEALLARSRNVPAGTAFVI